MELRAELEIRLGAVLTTGRGFDRSSRLALAIVAPAAFVALIHAVFTRGVWYDEFYTLYVSGPSFGWREALTRHWLVDNHPPLFYALARASGWLGASVEARRLLNLIVAILAFVSGWLALRGGGHGGSDRRPLGVFYFLFLASLAPPIPLAGELRSYFMSFCSVALLVLTVSLAQLDSGRPARGRALVMWLSALVAFNTHVVTSAIATAILVPFVGLALLRGDRTRLLTFVPPALVAGTVFLATTAVQLPLWMGNTKVFWLPAGADQAWGSLRLAIIAAVSGNVLMSLAAAFGLYLMARRAPRKERLPEELTVALLLVGGVVLAGVVLTALHLWRPLLIPKYLIGLFPPIGMVVAIGFVALRDRLDDRTALAMVFGTIALSLVAIGTNAAAVASFAGWDPAAREIRRQVTVCPDAAVHAGMRWNDYLAALQPPDNARVVPYSYRLVAARHGFAIEPAGSRRMSARCPTLFWGHIAGSDAPTPTEVLAYENSRGFALPQLWYYSIGSGWIASDRPLGGATLPAPLVARAAPPPAE